MTGHEVLVALTGLIFIGAGLVLLAVTRQLGREYVGGSSAPWWARALFGAAAVVLWWRGLSLIFPGDQMPVHLMSPNVTATAVVVLGLATYILDTVLRERNPPPILERILRVARREGVAAETMTAMALASPVAAYKGVDAARLDLATTRGRKRRWAVIGAALLTLLCIAGALIASAG